MSTMGDVDQQAAASTSPANGQNDETKEIFAKKISETITSGFVTLSLAIGRRTGLFDVLARQQEPRTSHEIAAAAGLKERYVREWLGSMVTSRIIEVDTTSDSPRYFIPPHRAAVLAPSGAEILRMAFSERVVHLAKVTDDMVECFKEDGPPGLPSSAYPDFQGWCQNVKGPMLDSTFIDNFLPTVPGLVEKLGKKN
ncbi:S-adenosylmethionine-dependent methyltransferase Rv2258c-like [Branchiostoma lanceolatum]|uniref:S-adenosylmethionine-dependent methyltransferase Rv2258c-like n=1 Tax=Branchiostoma lanceolatum TaxID=7740 RepID=UPI0034552BA0